MQIPALDPTINFAAATLTNDCGLFREDHANFFLTIWTPGRFWGIRSPAGGSTVVCLGSLLRNHKLTSCSYKRDCFSNPLRSNDFFEKFLDNKKPGPVVSAKLPQVAGFYPRINDESPV